MAMPYPEEQDYFNLQEDIVIVGDVANGAANLNGDGTVTNRNGAKIKTLAKLTSQIELTPGLLVYRETLAEAIADFAVGDYFASIDTGAVGPYPNELRTYKRIAGAPYYQDQGDDAAPISRASMAPYYSRVRLAELNPTDGQAATLNDGTNKDIFLFSATNLAAAVAADHAGRYIAPNSDPTGASGAWKRAYPAGSGISPLWWPGADPTGATDNKNQLQYAATACKATGEKLNLSVPYMRAIWGTTAPIAVDYNTTVEGDGTCEIKALAGFPATLSVTDPVGANKNIPAPILSFNGNDSSGFGSGLSFNNSNGIRLNGNGLAALGFYAGGGANFCAHSIRIDSTTFAAGLLCGVQNAAIKKIQAYQCGSYGIVGANGTYNSKFDSCDLRQVSVADLWGTEDVTWPYYHYFSGVYGFQECKFTAGIWEDSLGGTGGAGKESCIKLSYGIGNRFRDIQLHGKCTVATIFEDTGCSNNIFAPNSIHGVNHNAPAAILKGFKSILRDSSVSLFGAIVGSTLVDLIEIWSYATIENLYFPTANSFFSGKFIKNKSASPDDVARISFTPLIRHGAKSQRDSNTQANLVDAVVLFYETDTRRIAKYDPRSTIVNKWGDQPTYTPGDTTPSVECPDDVYMEVTNAGAITITNLTNIRVGQKATLIFKDANTSVPHGGAFRLTSKGTYVSSAQETKTFMKEVTTPFTLVEIGGVSFLKGSKTYDAPSIAAAGTTTTTVTVTSAAVGDLAIAALSVSLAGLQIRAEVTAANTVTVTLENATAGAIDLASATLSVKVWKA